MENISIVIPCYNHATELRGTLESLRRQTLKPREIVVVDNGSKDQPEKVVGEFADLPISLDRFKAKQGAPAARNRGAELVESPLIMFLDADVELEARALEKLSTVLEKHPEADFVYSDFQWGFKSFKSFSWDVERLKKINFIHTTALMRREAFPGFDEGLNKFQDWDLWLTMAERGSQGVYVPECLFKVRPRKAGISQWLPSFAHKLPWPIFGWTPREIVKYRAAEEVIRRKHGI